MNENAKIRKALANFVENRLPHVSVVCTVKSINMATLTCYCEPINGDAGITGVRLIAQAAKGFLIIPKVDSSVVVTFIDDTTAYVSMFSEVDEIRLNGDNYGGIPKSGNVATRINIIENKINDLFTAFNAWVISPGDGGGALKGLLIPPLTTPLSNTTQAQISSTTVKHGNGT